MLPLNLGFAEFNLGISWCIGPAGPYLSLEESAQLLRQFSVSQPKMVGASMIQCKPDDANNWAVI